MDVSGTVMKRSAQPQTDPETAKTPKDDWDLLIIGAGICGMYQLYRLRELGLDVTVVEANPDVGGTWYNNRYPGCRFDSESYSYGYSFSKEVLQEWNWSEHFAPQPETLRYLNYIADKFDLRRHIQFDVRVVAAEWDEGSCRWTVELDDGRKLTTRYLLTAVGLLSTPTLPKFEGRDTFEGQSFHTMNWPAEGVELSGKRVAVVGTGATGIQLIAAIAEFEPPVEQLTVFQRSAHWSAPLHNRRLTSEEMERIKQSYDSIFELCAASQNGFMHLPDPRKTLEVPEAERLKFWEALYDAPGFGIWLGNFKDTFTDPKANAVLSAFVADKIRQRVHDPAIAERLIPTDHGFGTRRLPLETHYLEAYNRDNVELVSLRETPIVRVTPKGIVTTEKEYEFDLIAYATGFDAVTGAFDHIDFSGVDGQQLRDKWRDGPTTYLGMQTAGFPNLFMLLGPQSGSAATNFPRGIEEIVNWMTDFIEYLTANGVRRVEVDPDRESAWVEHVREMSTRALMGQTKSWFTGHNTNLDRDERPRLMVYTGGASRYRQWLGEEAANDYSSFAQSA